MNLVKGKLSYFSQSESVHQPVKQFVHKSFSPSFYPSASQLDSQSALQAATILVAMVSEKKFWQPKFWRKSPIGDQQIKRESYST